MIPENFGQSLHWGERYSGCQKPSGMRWLTPVAFAKKYGPAVLSIPCFIWQTLYKNGETHSNAWGKLYRQLTFQTLRVSLHLGLPRSVQRTQVPSGNNPMKRRARIAFAFCEGPGQARIVPSVEAHAVEAHAVEARAVEAHAVEARAVESRDAYLGALRHLRERTDWSVVIFGVLMTPLHNLVDVSDLRRGQIDGALVSGRQIDIVDRCQKQGIPVVGMNRYPDDIPIPTVSHDDRAIGRLGARHFLRRGIRSLGFCGPDYASVCQEVNSPANKSTTMSWMKLRLQGFEEEARSAQVATVSAFCDHQAALREGESEAASMRRYWSDLRGWIRQLPRPAGILAGNDRWAINCLTACQAEGLDVPRDISVLGVDNDVFRCEESRPALSSIDRNMHQVGWTAADVLVRFLQTGEWCDTPILVPPAGIVERHSTQALTVANAKLSRALEFVRSHFCDPISATDVARAAGVSASWLRHAFQRDLHFSLVSEIRRLRVEKACELLTESDLPLKLVAEAAGFRHEGYLCHVFAQEMGMSPTAWRNRRCSR